LASYSYPQLRGRAHRRRGGAGEGEQARGSVDLAHMGSVSVGGLTGEAPDDGRRRGSGGASATARFPVQCGAELSHGWLWELEWRLGSSLESLVGQGNKRRGKLTCGANGGRWRIGARTGPLFDSVFLQNL
jgi:hypothetical protein